MPKKPPPWWFMPAVMFGAALSAVLLAVALLPIAPG